MFNRYLFHRKLNPLFLGVDDNYKCNITVAIKLILLIFNKRVCDTLTCKMTGDILANHAG